MVNLSLEQLKKIVVVNHPSVKQKIANMGTNYKELVTDTNTESRIDIALESLELKKKELEVLNLVNIFYYQYLALNKTYQVCEEEKTKRNNLKKKVLELRKKGYRSPIDLVAANSELRQFESILETLDQLISFCLKRLSLLVGVPELEIDNLEEEIEQFFEEPPPTVTEETIQNVFLYNSDITVAQLLIVRSQKIIDNTSLQNNPRLSLVRGIAKSKENISNLNDQIFELPKTEISLQDRVTVLYSCYKDATILYQESVEILDYHQIIYEKLFKKYSREKNQVDIPSFAELRLALQKSWSIYLQKIDALLTWRNVYELFTLLSS